MYYVHPGSGWSDAFSLQVGGNQLITDCKLELNQGCRYGVIGVKAWIYKGLYAEGETSDLAASADKTVDITERHVTLAFLWGRMKVVDEQLERTRVKLTHMTFEDFLEGVCRLAAYKAFPTDDELAASEYASAGDYVYRLRGEAPEDYENMVKARARPWGAQPLLRLERSVEHMCSLLIVTAQQGNGEDAAALDEKEAASFIPNAK